MTQLWTGKSGICREPHFVDLVQGSWVIYDSLLRGCHHLIESIGCGPLRCHRKICHRDSDGSLPLLGLRSNLVLGGRTDSVRALSREFERSSRHVDRVLLANF